MYARRPTDYVVMKRPKIMSVVSTVLITVGHILLLPGVSACIGSIIHTPHAVKAADSAPRRLQSPSANGLKAKWILQWSRPQHKHSQASRWPLKMSTVVESKEQRHPLSVDTRPCAVRLVPVSSFPSGKLGGKRATLANRSVSGVARLK